MDRCCSSSHLPARTCRYHCVSYLEALDEGPQQRPDALAATQQLHQSHDAEETEEVDADDV